MKTFGFVKSPEYEDQPQLKISTQVNLPNEYEVNSLMNDIRDQGQVGKCVSCSMTDLVSYNLNGKKITVDDFFYQSRNNKSVEGMSIYEAFNILKNKGFEGFKCKTWARINSEEILKKSLVSNGPSIIALPVYRFDIPEFWRQPRSSSSVLGGHAVLIVGYNKLGFIIRNSWGYDFGKNGTVVLPYSEFNKVIECWTLIS